MDQAVNPKTTLEKIDEALASHQKIADTFPPAVTSDFNRLRTALEAARPLAVPSPVAPVQDAAAIPAPVL